MFNNQSGFKGEGPRYQHSFGNGGREGMGEEGGRFFNAGGEGFGGNSQPGYERFGGRFAGGHGGRCPMEKLRALHMLRSRFGNWGPFHGGHGDGDMRGAWGRAGRWGHPHFGGGAVEIPGWGRGEGVAANIEEEPDAFLISLSVPGVDKESVIVSVRGDSLVVGYTASEDEANTEKNYIRREFGPGSFERSFPLEGKVLVDQISAAYTDGILKIRLPKNPESNIPPYAVEIE